MPESKLAIRVLAFDFGLRRIGVACGQTVSASASPLETIQWRNQTELWATINTLVETWNPDVLVLGQPPARDDADDFFAGLDEFAAGLRAYDLPLVMVDEAASSIEAHRVLRDARASGKKRRLQKSDIDAEAARIIAERWLQSQP